MLRHLPPIYTDAVGLVQRLRNGIYEAGITLGEGFVPALGRASTKLSEFLKQGENRAALKSIGEDIGRAIDDIDWKEVVDGAKSLVDVMKVALDFAKRLYDTFNLLPTPIKGAVAGLAVLDKLSGGLVGAGAGGVLGGLGSALAKSLATSIPIFGKAFVQPVFVTNIYELTEGGWRMVVHHATPAPAEQARAEEPASPSHTLH